MSNSPVSSYLNKFAFDRNKLDLPAAQDAFTAPGEKEIIEEYSEEDEKKWREEHLVKMRRHKEKEREEREKAADKDVDINALLDDLELMEELDYELENLEIDSDDKLHKIINGEIPLPPEKSRKAHDMTMNVESAHEPPKINTPSERQITSIEQLDESEDSNEESLQDDESIDSDYNQNSSDEDLPDEFKAYRFEAEEMSTVDKLTFYRKQLHGVQTRLGDSKVTTFDDFVRKTDQMFLCDHLQSEIDRLQGSLMASADSKKEIKEKQNVAKKPTKGGLAKRSVSFGADEVTSFRKDQAPLRVSEDIKNKLEANANVFSDDTSDSVQLSKDQLAEKERLLDYVHKVAEINVDEVTSAMNARYQERVRLCIIYHCIICFHCL